MFFGILSDLGISNWVRLKRYQTARSWHCCLWTRRLFTNKKLTLSFRFWGCPLEGPEKFSHLENQSCFIMNWGSLHSRSFRRIHALLCFQIQINKKCLCGPEKLLGLSGNGPLDNISKIFHLEIISVIIPTVRNNPNIENVGSKKLFLYLFLLVVSGIGSINFVIVFYLVTSSPLYFCTFNCL